LGARLEIMLRELGGMIWIQIASAIEHGEHHEQHDHADGQRPNPRPAMQGDDAIRMESSEDYKIDKKIKKHLQRMLKEDVRLEAVL
jgi:hypothetical protein